MQPRGYGEMSPAYLTKESSEKMTNYNDESPKNVSNIDPLAEMRHRHEKAWKNLGYDPSHGKGDMRESVTLNNFNPKKLLQENKINSKNLIDIKSNVPKQVIQSYSLCIKPSYKTLKRVNSSRNPTNKFIKEEEEEKVTTNLTTASLLNNNNLNYDVEEKTTTNLKNDSLLNNNNNFDVEEKTTTNLQNDSLLNSDNLNFDEEEEEEDEFEEEEINSDNLVNQDSVSDKTSSNKPINTYTYDFNNTNCNNFNKYNYDYKKANVSDLLNDKNSYFEDNDNEEQNQPLFYYFLEQQKTGRKTKPKPIPKTPKRSQKKKKIIVNYSHYDDPNFDWYLSSKNLPEGLQDDPTNSNNESENKKDKIAINFPKNSIVRRALCGESMISYPTEVSDRIILDLRIMLEQAISFNMVDECSYLNEVINNIKSCKTLTECGNEDQNSNSNSKVLSEKIEETQMAIDRRKQKWEAKKRILESEKQIQIEEVKLKYEEECKKLDQTWKTEKKVKQYNRPSTTLIKMRQQVRIQLSSHKFGDASQLAQKMIERDRKETEDASRKMQSAYEDDCERLRKKYEEEQKSIIESFETKLASISKKQNEDILPFKSRLIKYYNSLEENKLSPKKNPSNSFVSQSLEVKNKRPLTRSAIGRVKVNGSLKLPPLNSLSKPATPFRSTSSSSSTLRKFGKLSNH